MEIVTRLKLLNIRNFSSVRLSLDVENHIIIDLGVLGCALAFGQLKQKFVVEELRIPRVILLSKTCDSFKYGRFRKMNIFNAQAVKRVNHVKLNYFAIVSVI
jgi:hypothetical protein